MGGTRGNMIGITRKGNEKMPLLGILEREQKATENGDDSPENPMIVSDPYLDGLRLELTSPHHTWTRPLTALSSSADPFRLLELKPACLMKMPRREDRRHPEPLSAIQCIKRDRCKPQM
ncbi:hypothetical protein DUI87_25656 [Hirundo rustica rustica]|uniref:Uncharacterized protein n=1 Tax=Hirundo rustica rustica TaxID=333673 RepID=A0A3M0JGD4_HIRRU|nr:hypothetical protein DUI87_25656 [Hirundo rustica rustica]